jgi:hypothetical protein
MASDGWHQQANGDDGMVSVHCLSRSLIPSHVKDATDVMGGWGTLMRDVDVAAEPGEALFFSSSLLAHVQSAGRARVAWTAGSTTTLYLECRHAGWCHRCLWWWSFVVAAALVRLAIGSLPQGWCLRQQLARPCR